jgi:superfamily II DNA or RNA helicase
MRQSLLDMMAFRKNWRTYQSRLLDQLDLYLQDKRFHLVAAPGSGKTVLGLEIIRRLNQATLVLAPTITIRDQWVDRLIELFLPAGTGQPSWVSTELRKPALLTVTTYQALHAACAQEPEQQSNGSEDENAAADDLEPEDGNDVANHRGLNRTAIPEFLHQAGFTALVVDEAHHLRAEWWRTLTAVAEHLSQPTIVALTATPPYDVSSFEWQRYEKLCGPIDAEVSVPELIEEGDLCPHQDYVYFSMPTEKEQKVISEFRALVDDFLFRLKSNQAFKEALLAHPWILAPDDHIEDILDDPEYLSSMVIYLHAVEHEVPSAVLRALGLSRRRIPSLNNEWLEILLTHCLYSDDDTFSHVQPLLKSLRNELLAIGAIERRKVTLQNPADQRKLLTTSITKLKSVEEIVRLEAGALEADLRCVILTDFIRKTELPTSANDANTFEDIGIVPVFETLRRAAVPGIRLGVLSGSLVIVPSAIEDDVRKRAGNLGIDLLDLSITPLLHDPAFSSVEIRGEYYRGTVRLITSLFQQGDITVLVGTKSLLGEGWDAPCINALVLASFVGSFVLSNQMRGRAIRVDPARPQKTANIWHLVCVEPGPFGPGDDYELLVRRCSAFVGISATRIAIENGTERLGLGHPPFSRDELDQINGRTFKRALDREGLRQRWQEALNAGTLKQMTDGLRAPPESLPHGFVLANTIVALLIQAGWVALLVLQSVARAAGRARPQDFWTVLIAGLLLAAIASLPWTILALWRFLRHGTPEGSIRQIGLAILEALEFEGSIDRHAGKFRVYSNRNPDGSVFCWIGGGTGKEQATFLRALRETLGPIDNARYLLARRRIWRLFREDYFAVPEILARKKDFAEIFAQRWKRFVGPVQLVYTRTTEGRKLLLRARGHSLSGSFQKRAERVSCWK